MHLYTNLVQFNYSRFHVRPPKDHMTHRKPWHSGTYAKQAKAVRDTANANPGTTCWRCGRTKAEHHTKWQAGHTIDGQIGGELRAECTPCNTGQGAARGNRMRTQSVTRQW